MNAPQCKVCDSGVLRQKKKYRMSGIVVLIGYILLIPSVLGMLFSTLMLVTTVGAGGMVASELADETQVELSNAGIPDSIIHKVVSAGTVTEAEKASLTREQRATLESSELAYTAGAVGAGAGVAIVGGMAIFIGISSLVGGLIGWLLIMKKKVLACDSCGAVIAAS